MVAARETLLRWQEVGEVTFPAGRIGGDGGNAAAGASGVDHGFDAARSLLEDLVRLAVSGLLVHIGCSAARMCSVVTSATGSARSGAA